MNIAGQIIESGLDFSTLQDGLADRILCGPGFANTPPLLLLSVKDDGPGMAPDILSKVFQPYFTTKAPGKGTGLGLAIVQRLLKEKRGCLHVHSAPSQGTTLNVYLPAIVKR